MVKASKKTQLYENRFSYSKLTTFNNCKYGYCERYINHQKGIGNCFSSYGTLVHSLLERYAKGELSAEGLLDAYEWEFDAAVPEPFPTTKYCPDMRKLYYEQGVEFLTNFKGYSGLKILDVEEAFDMPLFDWTLTGVVDLVFIEQETNQLVLRDWKSKASFKNKKEAAEYRRQLYLYSPYIKKKYGRFPDRLEFYLIRKNDIVSAPFSEDDMAEAISWANNTVKEIKECWTYPPSPEAFFCNQLCNHRLTCPHRAR